MILTPNPTLLSPTRRSAPGFTLLELLAVMGIIALLAGLLIGISRYASQQALKAKARSQLQQIAQALELYKNDHGLYPITAANATKTNRISHTWDSGTTNNNLTLYTLLTGYRATNGPPSASPGRNYYRELVRQQLQTRNGTNYFVDPFGNPWGYFNTTNSAWITNQFNVRGYDLWSFGAKPGDPTNSLLCNWRQQ
jgi:prepilin-type N-terminal cleavage/methylation domain-containing protein